MNLMIFIVFVIGIQGSRDPDAPPARLRIQSGSHFIRTMCLASNLFRTIQYKSSRFAKTPYINYDQHMKSLSWVNAQISEPPAIFGEELYRARPELLYTFALYSGYAMCSSPYEIAAHTLPHKDVIGSLPTGKFELIAFEAFPAYSNDVFTSNQLDGQFFIAVNHEHETIVLAWKGSTTAIDFMADANGRLAGSSNKSFIPYKDRSDSNVDCKVPTNTTDFFFFSGFFLTMQQQTLNRTVQALQKAKNKFPSYSIILTGHSLGGAKAMINALYLSKFYSDTLPVDSVYTYGQPPLGSTNFGTWVANCIGPKKIIRVTSQWDLVPFSRVAENVNHPANVMEAYSYDAKKNVWRWCQGPDDINCSAGANCLRRSWNYHRYISDHLSIVFLVASILVAYFVTITKELKKIVLSKKS